MKRAILCLTLALFICLPGLAHPGRTDARGGHTNHSTGKYHYHHGYPEHQHAGGKCPYDFDDKTGENSGPSSSNKPRTDSSHILWVVPVSASCLGAFLLYRRRKRRSQNSPSMPTVQISTPSSEASSPILTATTQTPIIAVTPEEPSSSNLPVVVPPTPAPIRSIVFHEARTIVRMYNLDSSEDIYKITMYGTKYHRAGCYMLEKNFAYTYDVNLDVAIKEGYAPCKVCCRGMPEPDIERESFYRP